MRKLIAAAAFMFLPLSAFSAPESYTIDPTHTYPHFSINHLGFSTMHGRFNTTSGKLTLDQANKTGSVNVTIDAASIDTGFKKRDDHLRSPDFLNVVEFPEITYKSSKVTIRDNKTATVQGTLTMMGVSKPVQLEVASINCGINPMDPTKKAFVCGFDASAKIKRSDFGVKYALPAIGDEMVLKFEVEAIRD